MAPCMLSARKLQKCWQQDEDEEEEHRERDVGQRLSKRHCRCFSNVGVLPSLWRQSERWPPVNLTRTHVNSQARAHTRLASIFHCRNISAQQYFTPTVDLTSQWLRWLRRARPGGCSSSTGWAKSNRADHLHSLLEQKSGGSYKGLKEEDPSVRFTALTWLATCQIYWSITLSGSDTAGCLSRELHLVTSAPLQTSCKDGSPTWPNEVHVLLHITWLKPSSHLHSPPPPVQSMLNLHLRHPFSSSVTPPLRSREVGPHVNSQWTASGLTSFFFCCCSLAETLENFSGHVLLIPLSFPPLFTLFPLMSPSLIISQSCSHSLSIYICTYLHIRGMFWF